MGYGHIAAAHAQAMNEFYREHTSASRTRFYLRPCTPLSFVLNLSGQQVHMKLLKVVVFLALPCLRLCAQSSGEITGTVTDSTGAVIGGAVITISNTATNQIRSATTNNSGTYSVPYLAPGIYDVKSSNAGFKVETRKGVELQVGAVARIDFQLEVGE